MATSAATMSLPTEHNTRAPGFIACVTIITVAALALVSLRTYVRLAIVRKFGSDDLTALLALICAIVAVVFNGVQVHYGFGQHASHLSAQQQIEVRKWNFALRFPILIGSGLSKISVSLLLLRLLGNAAGRIRKLLLRGINVFICIYTLIDIINDVVSCNPTAKAWNLELPGTCRSPDSIVALVYFQGACASAVSLLLSTLPTIFFRTLQMPLRTKVVLCVLTSLGIFDAVCSIVRTALLPDYDQSLDFSYTAIPITTWATLELNFAIFAACIPPLRPLFRFFDKRTSSSQHPSKRGFLKQTDNTSQSHRIGPENQIPSVSGQYRLTSFERGKGDNRSNSSMEFLRIPAAISKTTDIHVTV